MRKKGRDREKRDGDSEKRGRDRVRRDGERRKGEERWRQ